jgi:hypothetical protein
MLRMNHSLLGKTVNALSLPPEGGSRTRAISRWHHGYPESWGLPPCLDRKRARACPTEGEHEEHDWRKKASLTGLEEDQLTLRASIIAWSLLFVNASRNGRH